MLDFLPSHVQDALGYLNLNNLYEIRLRSNAPVLVNYQGEYVYLGEYGIVKRREKALIVEHTEIGQTVYRAGNYSIYSVEEQIKQGFLTTKDGIRLGLAGQYVYEKGKVLSIRDFSSLCIRIPHEIEGEADRVFTKCFQSGICSILILSKAGQGKTTLLREIAKKIADTTQYNLLICDERGEIACFKENINADIMLFADKMTAFSSGIRAMRPDVILCDECTSDDMHAVRRAVESGVIVIASAHCDDIKKMNKAYQGVFSYYVLIGSDAIGKIVGIYDNSGNELPFHLVC